MPAVKKSHVKALRPYLVGDRPNSSGEWSMHCPLHGDKTRSASLNVQSGKWYCHACADGGSVSSLVRRMKKDGIEIGNSDSPFTFSPGEEDKDELPTELEIRGMHSSLMSSGKELADLMGRRGLTLETLRDYGIGWSDANNAYTIPIRDENGELVNVRYYQLDVPDDRRKIWSVKGHGAPDLYPIDQLDEPVLVITEGEWDALISIQNGIPAITRTGAAKVWEKKWNLLFQGKTVFPCQDSDKAGRAGNKLIETNLADVAKVHPIELPYEYTEKHGKDVSDFWLDRSDDMDSAYDEFVELMDAASSDESAQETETIEPDPDNMIRIQDSFSPDAHGRDLTMRVTISGKTDNPYLLPKLIEYSCTMDAGQKCSVCPMEPAGGEYSVEIKKNDPILLKMMGATEQQLKEILREVIKAEKCTKLVTEPSEMHSSSQFTVRPNVDTPDDADAEEFAARPIVVVDDHAVRVNTTVDVHGALYPSPKTQANEFLAHDVVPVETSIDRFDLTPDIVARLKRFRPAPGQRPIAKAGEIADEMAKSVTRIYNRKEMHIFMDLVFHSVIAWDFNTARMSRGWLEGVILGDTRTGKSEAASKLIDYYGAGTMVSCEAASFAGVVGGVQQIGGKHWEITWGVVPLNDRRLVVLDEISGLDTEEIAKMSSIRSSGVAEITKIRTDKTRARTRLMWLGNPRGGTRMADHTYGINALRPLIGNNEDIARFDMAMAVTSTEVSSAEINSPGVVSHNPYGREDCHDLVRYAWSRTSDQVRWAKGVEKYVLEQAIVLGGNYVEDPPLIQAANVRVKIARIAVALAARTFSTTPKDPEIILVKKSHVRDAVWFLNRIYSIGNFGYRQYSDESLYEASRAAENIDKVKKKMEEHPELAKFFKTCYGNFRANDMGDMLAMDPQTVSILISELYEMGMLRRQGAHIKIMPVFHNILRSL